MVRSMKGKRNLFVLGLLLTVVLGLHGLIVTAHTPGPMNLEYNTDTDILTVTVVHSTADPNTHYIYEIVIEKNSVQVDSQTYTSQIDPTQVVETFTISAVDGDTLRATAKCSVSGQVSETLTIGGSTTGTTDTSPDFPITLTIGLVVVILGVLFVIIGILKRR